MLRGVIGAMKVNFNQLDRGFEKYKNEYNNAALEVLKSGWYVLGNRLNIFEHDFSEFLGVDYCVGLNSGLDALILAFRALNIGMGDEVIVPANTYIASVLGITENGATPVFVDPDEFYNLNASEIEEKITNKTKAILIVHLYGQAANLERIKEIADEYGLYLVEDCAQSHGACFAGKATGSWGDIGCFSFYPTKNIGAFGDAGAIVTSNIDIFEKVKMLRNYGSKVKYRNEVMGLNSRMDEIQAALLSVKLRKYNELRAEREIIAKEYLNKIENPYIIMPRTRETAEHVWHLFVVKVNERDVFQQYLSDSGIATQIHYPIPPHLSEAYKHLGLKEGSHPVTENYAKRILSLPLFEGMTKEEIEYVILKVNSFKPKGDNI